MENTNQVSPGAPLSSVIPEVTKSKFNPKKTTLGAVILVIIGLLAAFLVYRNREVGVVDQTINIVWAEWAPSDYLVELSKDFTQETGIKVNLTQINWTDFYKNAFEELNAKSGTYDIIVGDSQWLGESITKGHYIELTKWIKDKKVDQTMTAATMLGYSEYPKGDKRYWSVPLEGDANGWAYRKDLFEDPKEKAAFLKKYGYQLTVPETWQQLRDIAEFFTRPSQDLYGLSMWTAKAYDGVTAGFQPLLWSWGADLGDYETYRVRGVLDSREGIDALEFYKQLYKFNPPNWNEVYWPESNNAFTSGRVAMVMNYFAFFPDLVNPSVNKHADVTDFFAMPSGPKGRFASLGGQGASVISYSKNKELAFKYLEWFIRKDVQEKWARLGGFTCNAEVLDSQEFQLATPFNKAFADSMQIVKDFWSVPEYSSLLAVSQDRWNRFLTGAESAEKVMRDIASEWENIFEYAGYYKE